MDLLLAAWPTGPSLYWLFYAVAPPLVILTVIVIARLLQRWHVPFVDLLMGRPWGSRAPS